MSALASEIPAKDQRIAAKQAYFAQKEARIREAIEKADALYQKYVVMLPNWPYRWDFNLLHDLKWRMEQRF